jgi:hypothetical protein
MTQIANIVNIKKLGGLLVSLGPITKTSLHVYATERLNNVFQQFLS